MAAAVMVRPEELQQEGSMWSQELGAIVITNQETYDQVAQIVIELTALEKKIIEHHAPIKKATDAAHKAAVKTEKDLLLPVQSAKAKGKLQLGNWEREQERLRQEEERLRREASDRVAREIQLQAAVEVEKHGGSEEEVAAVLNTPVNLPEPVVARTFVRAAGVSTSERWHAEIDSIKELCAAIGRGDQPETFAMGIEWKEDKTTGAKWLSSSSLNTMATTMKTTMNIPGVRAVPETSVSVRSS